ncbi:MAG: twin-arginine translocase subunit TatC [Polyangiales bacterium]
MADASPSATRPEDEVEMSFVEHLEELRTRLIRVAYGLVPAMALAWFFKERLLELLAQPLVVANRRLKGTAAGSDAAVTNLDLHAPMDALVAYFKLTFVAGLMLSAPWIFWQLWAFISPGLYRREKRLAIPFVLASTLFFLGGAAFGYFIVFPMAFETLLSFSGTLPGGQVRLDPELKLQEHLSFTTRLLVAFGVVFEVPVVVTFLAAIGLVNWRQLLRFSRWWVLIATILAAMLTPPDVVSQLLMLVPLVTLYFVAVLLAAVVGRRRAAS